MYKTSAENRHYAPILRLIEAMCHYVLHLTMILEWMSVASNVLFWSP